MVFTDTNNPLLPNGSYKINLMSNAQKHVCSDQPSGLLLKGGNNEISQVPPGIIVIEDYLDPGICKGITEYSDMQSGSRLQVMHRDPITGEVKSKPDEGRITEHVAIDGIQGQLSNIIEKTCREVIEPHYRIDIEWYERPSLLRYGAGGKYEHHSDSENWDASTGSWNRFCDRAYSLLLYLNEEFTGGSLYFKNFDYRLTPKTGMLVAFPSDHRYVHRAEPVNSGTRYAVVSWIVVKGRRYFTRGKPIPPHAVPME